MNSRTTRLAASSLAVRPVLTGHLLADCERWCRDSLPPRRTSLPREALRPMPELRTAS